MEELVAHYRSLLSSVVRDRRMLLCLDVALPAAPAARLLRELGAAAVAVLSASLGTAEDVDEEVFDDMIVLGLEGTSIMDGIRKYEAALQALPEAVLQRLDAFDPDRSALAVPTLWAIDTPVAGREVYGGRPAEWRLLEDKILVEDVFAASDVVMAPSKVIESKDATALAAAHGSLDQGLGTAWVADNRDGWHGGGEMLRWVRTDAELGSAVDLFRAKADRVRVMPFLDGIPCSIHGIVFPDYVAALRPVEMVVLRGATGILYAGAATLWDPPTEDGEYMRQAARRVGAHLQRSFGYRGAFTIDGVLTADGFRPTELNPRYGAGLGALSRGIPDLPMYWINLMVVAAEPFDFRPRDLEAAILETAWSARVASAHTIVTGRRDRTQKIEVRWRGGALEIAPDEEDGAGTILLGPSAQGGFVSVRLDPDQLETGRPMAPLAAEALRLADEHWGLGMGVWEAAPDVRRPTDH